MDARVERVARLKWDEFSAWRLLHAAVLTLGSALAIPAHATLIGDSVTAQLLSPNGITPGLDPNPVSLSDTVTVVSPGIEISAGNGTNIGGFMLTGVPDTTKEFIDFRASSIVLRILAGDVVGGVPVTGYASGGKYVFSDLDFLGGTITGITFSASDADIANLAGLGGNWITLDGLDTIAVMLDQIQFVDKAGTDFADITINLQTGQGSPPPLPEPSSLALFGLSLSTLWLIRRKRPMRQS